MFQKILAGLVVMALAFTGAPAVSSAAVEVGDNLKLFGDFRLRLEYDKRDPGTGTDDERDSRERPRLRLRFGAKYQTAVEGLSFGFRLATASSFNSPHSDLATASGSTGQADFFGVDRAYAQLKFLQNGVVIVGKQAYPLWQQTEQFWDEDTQPEGYAVAYTAPLGDMGSATAAAAYYYILNNGWEKSLFDNDAILAYQITYKGSFGNIKPVLAFTGMSMIDGDDDENYSPPGETWDDAPTFLMFSAQLNTEVEGYKLRVGVDFHQSNVNVTTAGATDEDAGYVAQVRVKRDNYGVRYYYYDIEENSVPSYGGTVLSQDNWPNSCCTGLQSAPVGFEGHRIQFDYKIAKNVSADFRIYLNEAKTANFWGESCGTGTRGACTDGADRDRYQLNFNVKF